MIHPFYAAMKFPLRLQRALGPILLLGWLVALLSHSMSDVAWSTSGRHANSAAQAHSYNWLGSLGAYVSDITLYIAGWSMLVLPLFLLVYRFWSV